MRLQLFAHPAPQHAAELQITVGGTKNLKIRPSHSSENRLQELNKNSHLHSKIGTQKPVVFETFPKSREAETSTHNSKIYAGLPGQGTYCSGA